MKKVLGDNSTRWPEPRLKKPWQRILLILVIGLAIGLMVQWSLTVFDPEKVVYTRRWRRLLMILMLEIARPEVWFWIIFIYHVMLAILTEIYYSNKNTETQE